MSNQQILVDEVYPSRFLRGAEIDGTGWLVTISNVYQEELKDFNGQPKMKIILALSELDKEIALNQTQARDLSDFYGPDAIKWVGQRVAISPEKLKNGQVTIRFTRGQPQVPMQQAPTPRPVTATPPVDIYQTAPPPEESENELP